VFMPFFSSNRGGPDITAMWLVQGLCSLYEVTLVTTRQFDLSFFNRFAGTNLTGKDFHTRIAPTIPCPSNAPMTALQGPLFQRFARRLARGFDTCISAMNLVDFGVRGIHFLADLDWPGTPVARAGSPCVPPVRKRRPALRRLYHQLCLSLYDRSGRDQLHQDLLISNSAWVASALHEVGIDSPVVYPPVPFAAHATEWQNKRPDFVWLGRIAPSKRLETAIAIVGRLRASGADCKLHIVGNAIDKQYDARIRELARIRGAWVVLEGPKYGAEKARFLSQFRYAIHTRADEPFGISLVELIKSGCIPFGPNSCGSAEILRHEDLLFMTEPEAASKILRVMHEPGRIDVLCQHLEERARCFSTDHFCSSVQNLVGEVLGEKSSLVTAAGHVDQQTALASR